jgi:ketosteroid isomerase-like protein
MGRCVGAVLAAAMLASGCRSSGNTAFTNTTVLAPSSESEAAHDELLRADLSRADSAARLGVAGGLSAVLTDDVIYLRGGLPLLRGRSVARMVLASDTSLSRATVRWQPVRVEVSRDGKNGYSYGYAVFASPKQETPAVRVDRYLAFWRRVGEHWKISGYAETYGTPPALVTASDAILAGMLADVAMSQRTGPLDAIRSADTKFSQEASRIGAGAAFGQFAAPDAQIFSGPGEFVTGPDAIAQSFGPPNGRSSLVWHPVEGEMSSSGDLGFTVGNAVFTDQREGGEPLVRYSKYLTVWKKQRDGTWKYVVDGGSARPKS